MATSQATANWKGNKDGEGKLAFTGYEGKYTFASRFEDAEGTNPEELVGAALAGCYTMFMAVLFTKENLNPDNIDTKATVTLGKDDSGPHIQEIVLDCKVTCSGLDNDKLQELAAISKEKCPISRLYAGGTATIKVNAELVG